MKDTVRRFCAPEWGSANKKASLLSDFFRHRTVDGVVRWCPKSAAKEDGNYEGSPPAVLSVSVKRIVTRLCARTFKSYLTKAEIKTLEVLSKLLAQ
jgi:hypothetical protein